MLKKILLRLLKGDGNARGLEDLVDFYFGAKFICPSASATGRKVVVLSDDPAFLASFAESSLRGRLLVWATRLLVVTRLPLQELRRLLALSWTFSMMNAMALRMEDSSGYQSPAGAQVVRVASWSAWRGLTLVGGHKLFPQKFTNFHGATVNVTALPFRPYWTEKTEVAPNGTAVTTYTGSDALMMHAMAQALNFTFHVLPSKDWNEVTSQVVQRKSFIASVIHSHLPQREKMYDFTYNYEFVDLDFSLAKPSLRPSWQGLYYPLSNEVWLCILFVLLLTPFLATLVICNRESEGDVKTMSLKLIGSLLGQSMASGRGESGGSRVFVASWLVFAFVVGTAYRGNLTPARPGSKPLPSLLRRWTAFFLQSESEIYQALGSAMEIMPDILSGLNQIINKYLRVAIADHFTLADGSNSLYVGREKILTSIVGLPVPHDAPYKPQIDRFLMMMIEAGLYEKWSEDMLSDARRDARRKQLEQLEQLNRRSETAAEETEATEGNAKALSVTHMQGPLLLLLLGLMAAGLAFLAEVLAGKA
ncbi:Variant Ionotropic Glutamate Receptor [Penaeus vannamei]|uniref:Variant Ionotropic Glutamate Receptor n=1 Tax=Penaeus vannamei TaxID=6689 RepID=A0A423TS56_PENVA|nr:Variant Ionotropic Glutamate Receptor [Penaeus vannamei]